MNTLMLTNMPIPIHDCWTIIGKQYNQPKLHWLLYRYHNEWPPQNNSVKHCKQHNAN